MKVKVKIGVISKKRPRELIGLATEVRKREYIARRLVIRGAKSGNTRRRDVIQAPNAESRLPPSILACSNFYVYLVLFKMATSVLLSVLRTERGSANRLPSKTEVFVELICGNLLIRSFRPALKGGHVPSFVTLASSVFSSMI
uniref:FACT complex subunit n=1 Tax=Parascaris univalens TaxID=6257 RepID=A0A915BVX0_PARUN